MAIWVLIFEVHYVVSMVQVYLFSLNHVAKCHSFRFVLFQILPLMPIQARSFICY